MGVLCSAKPSIKIADDDPKLKELKAILFCLSHIKFLSEKFRKSYKIYHKKDECLTDYFKEIIEKIWSESLTKIKGQNKITFSIKKESKKFLGVIYKDRNFEETPKLLIEFIINRLHEELNKMENKNEQIELISQGVKDIAAKEYFRYFKKNHQSIISDNFFMTEYTQTSCSFCQSNFFDFKFSIYKYYYLDQIYNYKCQIMQNSMIPLYDVNIYDCLNYDQKIIQAQDLCKRCRVIRDIYYKNNIFVSPKIIIFIFNNKTNVKFSYEEKINISQFVEKQINIIYDLIIFLQI